MPNLADAPPTDFVKLLLIGESGSGKTGSLACLAQAGYRLHFLDFDGGLQFLTNYLRRNAPDALKNVDYVYLRDEYRGGTFVRPARAYKAAAKLLDKWEDGSVPKDWGHPHILVVDSLTNLGIAALNEAYTIKPVSASGARPDGKMIYGMAQESLSALIYAAVSPAFQSHVVFITHITEIEIAEGVIRGFPKTVGEKLSRTIAKDFNTVIVCERTIAGNPVLRTVPNKMSDAKVSTLDLPKELPIEDGMLRIFNTIRNK